MNLMQLIIFLDIYNIIFKSSQLFFILPIKDIIGTNFGIKNNDEIKYGDKITTINTIKISPKR